MLSQSSDHAATGLFSSSDVRSVESVQCSCSTGAELAKRKLFFSLFYSHSWNTLDSPPNFYSNDEKPGGVPSLLTGVRKILH